MMASHVPSPLWLRPLCLTSKLDFAATKRIPQRCARAWLWLDRRCQSPRLLARRACRKWPEIGCQRPSSPTLHTVPSQNWDCSPMQPLAIGWSIEICRRTESILGVSPALLCLPFRAIKVDCALAGAVICVPLAWIIHVDVPCLGESLTCCLNRRFSIR